MTKKTKRYEIAIVGGLTTTGLRTIRIARHYRTYEAALAAAQKAAAEIDRRGYPRAAHPVIVYDPDGKVVA